MIKFNVEESLADTWTPIIERQVNLVLSPMHSDLKSIEINFSQDMTYGGDTVWYRCETRCLDNKGTSHYAETLHPDGRLTVTDTLARVRRGVVRSINVRMK